MIKTVSLMAVAAGALLAQGPGPGGPPPGGGRGFGGRIGEFGLISAGPGSRIPVTGAPYSAVETTQFQQKLADGNEISRQETSKIYRDGQGRVRTEHTATPPGTQTPQTRITIFDPVAGFNYVLNPAAMTVMKMPVHVPAANNTATPRMGVRAGHTPPQTQTETLPAQVINGVQATGTRSTTTIPAGAIGNQQPILVVREVWISTALKVPIEIKTSDPRFGTTQMELTSISQAEPDAALFLVPVGYTVTTRGEGNGWGGGGGAAGRMRGPRR